MRQNVKTRLRRVTETGVLLALLIVLQAATRSAGQYVTGTCVNAVLALAVLGAAVACTVPSVMVTLPGVVAYQYARVYTWLFDRDIRVQAVLDAAAGES